MTSKEKISDIKYLIMETYSNEEPLSENQKESRNCFLKYCDEIMQDLQKLEDYETIFKTPIKELREELKVLEILKKYLVIRKGNKTLSGEQRYVMYFKSIPIPKEIVFKVKNWLEERDS